jgi:Phosphotransferase enzyme family
VPDGIRTTAGHRCNKAASSSTDHGVVSNAPVAELLARASSRRTVNPSDGKSSSTFERVTIDGQGFFLKRLSPARDWIMRVTGDRFHRPYLIWRAGIMDRAPLCIDHTVVAMEIDGEGDDAELSMLMRDISPYLLPEGDALVSEAQHAGFIEAMAELSAAFWGWTDSIGNLTTMAQRIRFFDRPNVAREMAVGEPPGPIAAADAGWRRLPERSPFLADLALRVQEHPELVTEPLLGTPTTFVHGDWKMGNLGRHPDGRTILLDWAYPGSGPACWDLCWYLALNRARLPEQKQAAITRFRAALESHGIATAAWWQEQLDLCLIGIMATFGWEKALGDANELSWWEARVAEAVARQHIRLP